MFNQFKLSRTKCRTDFYRAPGIREELIAANESVRKRRQYG